MKKLGNKGMTLVEVMAAMVILAIVCGGMLTIVVTSSKANTNSSDKQFAANQASNITQLWLWYVKNDSSNNLEDFTKIINGTDSTNSTKLDIEIAGCAKYDSNEIIIYYTADKMPVLINKSQTNQSESSTENSEPTNAIYKIVISQNTITITITTKTKENQSISPNLTISIEVFKKHKETWDTEPFYKV